MRRRVVAVLAVLLAASTLTACGGGGGQTLTVFAASSLTGSFDTLASRFEQAHPGVTVRVSYDSSTTLAEQIAAGAPADVLATADQQSLVAVERGHDLAARPVQFATNTLVIVTPPSNPGHVSSVADLAHAAFVVCDPSAPCGAAAKTILHVAGITAKPKSYEADVKSVLAKVQLGDVDAGIVYVTDAKAAGTAVRTVAIPSRLDVTNPYFVAPVKGAAQPRLAREWVALVLSKGGQQVLRRAGFGPQQTPPSPRVTTQQGSGR